MVSAEIAQNKNATFFLKKVFVDMGEKVAFTNCSFEKLRTLIVFSAKRSSCNKKLYVEQTEIYENGGLFLNMAKVFFVHFSGF